MNVLRNVVVSACLVLLVGCNGPLGFIPGGRLAGPEERASDWAFAGDFENLELETSPDDPYSVRVNFVLRDGRLYVDPTPERGWGARLAADGRVRVRFDQVIYPATAVAVDDAAELEGFEADRMVFRLEVR